ncbi:MAG: TCR/Tet family MFS transporter [Acidimicrobiia bacterium]|nr:TCR/Tet family MFS transporter [Acidimicrobiia bacterium]
MSPVAIIFVTIFIDLIGFGIIIPLLPFYAESFGATALTVGLLNTSFSFMQFLFAPFWGRLSDRIGRRPVILIGLFGSFLSYMLFGMATSLAVLFVARIAAGIAGANVATAQAYMADVTTPENRARGMGLVGAAFGLGFILGPAIGGFLSQFGYSVPSYFAAALSLANFAAAWKVLPESRPATRGARTRVSRLDSFRVAMLRPGLSQLLLVYFLVIAAFSSFEATFALFGGWRFGLTAATIGYIFAFVGVILSIVQGGLVGRLARRFGERRLVPPAILALVAGLALIPAATSIPWLLVASGLLAVGMGLNSPSVTALISRLSAADEQGRVLGVSQSAASLARIVGPTVGGFAYDHFGKVVPYVGASGVMFVAFLISVATLPRVGEGR